MSSTSAQDSSVASPFCFRCGYNLTGLSFPHACPECGEMHDPLRDQRNARQWFAGRWSWLLWILRPSRTPIGLLYVLYDPVSARIARNRRLTWLWLPGILSTLLVLGGVCVKTQYDVHVWYYKNGDTLRTPQHSLHVKEWDRIYCQSWHPFRGDTDYQNAALWVEVVERTREGWEFGLPQRFNPIDGKALLYGGWAWGAIFFAYLPAQGILILNGRRGGRARNHETRRSAATAIVGLPVQLPGAVLWVWVGLLLVIGISDALADDRLALMVRRLEGWPMLLWSVAAILSWTKLLSLDRARKLFVARACTAIFLMFLTVIGPFAAIWVTAMIL